MKKVLFPISAVVLALSLALPMAAVVGAQPASDTIYGITNTGSIHRVNPISGLGTEIDTVVACPTGGSGPNGLAYDQDTNRIYYLEYPDQVYTGYPTKDGKASLYFTDLDTGDETFAGLLPGEIADADIYEGHYYYIAGGGSTGYTDDLYKVDLLADGKVGTITKYPDISAPDNHAYGFWGDIAIQNGVIYGIGDCKLSGHGYEFFTVNCDGTGFDYIADVTVGQGLQVAFGLDGILYGHDFLNGNFYTITWTDTSVTVSPVLSTGAHYTDLASGITATKCGDLIAGQHIDVGDVIVSNDGTYLYVTYEITEPDWVITETHLYVGKNLSPTTAPGQFPYDDDDATSVTDTMVTYVIPLDDIDSYSMQLNKKGKPTGVMVADGDPGVTPCNDIYIAAHAVVMDMSCYETAILYGIQRNTGTVYGIDVLSGASWEEFDITSPPPTTNVGPNGLAYDATNGRWYYCDYSGTSILYFWDGSQHTAGTLPYGNIADADLYNGKYYYITGPPASDDLYEVTLNADGTINTQTKLDDIADDAHGWTFNGDIAAKDGVVYGWGLCGTHNKYEFFTYDLTTNDFTVNKPDYQSSLQLGFGSDGTLYGHRSGGAGEFYVVDTTDGDVTMVTPTPDPANWYTDCSSGEICVPVTETAWGYCETNGGEFPGANWATYLTYHVHW